MEELKFYNYREFERYLDENKGLVISSDYQESELGFIGWVTIKKKN